MPRVLAMVAVLLISVGCASPASQTGAKASPHASPQPSASPSPSPPPLTITSASFHAGELAFGYAPARPVATGGVPPYNWSIAAGSLPGGLAMDPSGAVAGTPQTLGAFLFTVQATDSTGTTASIDTTISIVKRLAVTPTCPSNFPCMVEAGCVTVCGGFGNLSGGIAPYTYRLMGGAIPTGMGLNGFALTKTFPAPSGTGTNWTFSVKVTDGVGATAQTAAVIHVFPHITFSPPSASCTGTTLNAGCTANLTYTGGTPGLPSPNILTNPSPPPTQWVVTASNGTVTLTIPPRTCPTPGKAYNAPLTIVLVDGSVCGTGSANCSTPPATVKVSLVC